MTQKQLQTQIEDVRAELEDVRAELEERGRNLDLAADIIVGTEQYLRTVKNSTRRERIDSLAAAAVSACLIGDRKEMRARNDALTREIGGG